MNDIEYGAPVGVSYSTQPIENNDTQTDGSFVKNTKVSSNLIGPLGYE